MAHLKEPALRVVYALCDPATGKVRYVGATSNLARRLSDHLAAAKRNVSPVCAWVSSLVARGLRPRLVELETVSKEADWEERERYWIAFYHSTQSDLLNVAKGGFTGAKSNAHRAALAKANRELGRRLATSAQFKDTPLTDSHRAKISAALTQYQRLPEHNSKIGSSSGATRTGKPLSQTHRANIAAAMLGRSKSLVARSNMRAAQQAIAAARQRAAKPDET